MWWWKDNSISYITEAYILNLEILWSYYGLFVFFVLIYNIVHIVKGLYWCFVLSNA